MTQKEQLIKLILNSPFPKDILQFSKRSAIECDICCSDIESFADYLLKNGVIVPPCNVGDTVYRLERNLCGDPVSQNVEFIWFTKDQIVLTTKSWNVSTAWLGNDFYLTREAAKQALKERGE